MPETIHIVPRCGKRVQFLFKVALTIQPLSCEGFTRRNIAVRLYPPASHNLPSPLRNTLFDFFKHLWVIVLHPLIKCRGTACKYKVLVLVHPVERRSECRLHLLKALLPVPKPYRVQMRVPDHVQLLIFHNTTLAFRDLFFGYYALLLLPR